MGYNTHSFRSDYFSSFHSFRSRLVTHSSRVQIAWAAISQYIIQPIQEAYDWISAQIGELVTWLSTQWELIKVAAQVAWGLFKQYITQPVQEAWDWVKERSVRLFLG